MDVPKYMLNLTEMAIKLREVYPYNLLYEIAECYRMEYAYPRGMINNTGYYMTQVSIARLFAEMYKLDKAKAYLLQRKYNDNATWDDISKELEINTSVANKMHVDAIRELSTKLPNMVAVDNATLIRIIKERNDLLEEIQRRTAELIEYRKRYKEDQEAAENDEVYKKLMATELNSDPRIKAIIDYRFRSILCDRGITTLGKLVSMTEKECANLPSIGTKAMGQINDMLKEFRLSFKK